MNPPPSWTKRARANLRRPTPALLVIVCGLLALTDWADQRAGGSVVLSGLLDEPAHLLTTLIVVWALGRRVTDRFLWPALIISVAIDIDHIPQYLGHQFLTAGTPRPYPHSMLTVIVLLALAAVWRRRRTVVIGVVLGLVIHFWRDLAEPGTGVALAWPVSNASFSLPHWSYMAGLAVVAAVDVARAGGAAIERSPTPRARATAPRA